MVAKARNLPVHSITLFALGGVAQIEKEAGEPSTEFLDGHCWSNHERFNRIDLSDARVGTWVDAVGNARYATARDAYVAGFHQYFTSNF